MKEKITKLQNWRHLVLAAVLLVLALFFKVALLGYTMLACVKSSVIDSTSLREGKEGTPFLQAVGAQLGGER